MDINGAKFQEHCFNISRNQFLCHMHFKEKALQTGGIWKRRLCVSLRWLNRVMQDHEARASDLNRKLIFLFFLLFS